MPEKHTLAFSFFAATTRFGEVVGDVRASPAGGQSGRFCVMSFSGTDEADEISMPVCVPGKPPADDGICRDISMC